ncbi:MAG: hypothetical protein JWP93_466 [Polaromonas sp.]|nr:hypothetical protein [Polaromonas sp.]
MYFLSAILDLPKVRSACIAVMLLACSWSPAAFSATPEELFKPIAGVVTHPRCLNCHASGDFPTQGDKQVRHTQMVMRGDGHGLPTLRCVSCHQTSNSADGRIPGAREGWQMPPKSMAWAGLSAAQICAVMTNPAKNGNRKTSQDLIDHMLKDDLVHWAWAPGLDRSSPPLPFDQFIDALKTWSKAGAPCPK